MAINPDEQRDTFGPLVVGRKPGRPILPKEIRDGIRDRLRTLWDGLQLKEVARRLGYEPNNPVHVKRLQRYQASRKGETPDLTVLLRISTAFHVGLDHLVLGQSRHLPVEAADEVNAALRATVTDELRRRYDYDPTLIDEVLPKDLLGFTVEDQSRRIRGFRATVAGTEGPRGGLNLLPEVPEPKRPT